MHVRMHTRSKVVLSKPWSVNACFQRAWRACEAAVKWTASVRRAIAPRGSLARILNHQFIPLFVLEQAEEDLIDMLDRKEEEGLLKRGEA